MFCRALELFLTWTPCADGDEVIRHMHLVEWCLTHKIMCMRISQIPNNPLQSFTDGKLVSTVPMMIVSEGSTLEFSMMTPVVYSSPCSR